MKQSTSVVGVIPARWASSRFPGKALTPVCGKPLVQWVWERARQASSLEEVIIATDDERIQRAAQDFGAGVVMTRDDHPSGTDRVAEAISGRDAGVVINIQGDEPLIDPALIDELSTTMLRETSWDMATAAVPLEKEEDVHNPSVVKAVRDREGRALYFSRSVIPFVRDGGKVDETGNLHLRHLGIYAYRTAFLSKLVSTPPCAIEQAEQLEQLRALDIGCSMKVITWHDEAMGVDEPEDVARVEELINTLGLNKS